MIVIDYTLRSNGGVLFGTWAAENIPAGAAESVILGVMRDSEDARKGTEHILVIDDELACLELTQAMLIRYGYTVIPAQSGRQALELFQNSPDTAVDLAIIDIVMHDMTGLEVAREIRWLKPGLPILFVSSYSQDPSLRPPATRDIPFLAKPFSSITLTEKIRELLAPRAASAGEQM